jgi:hypothetical protein
MVSKPVVLTLGPIVLENQGNVNPVPEKRGVAGAMIEASCHCGAVCLEVDAPLSEVAECNCSICRRYGALWAYYPLDQVRVLPPDPPTNIYMWNDRMIEFHHCLTCGCVSHWTPADREHNRMAVNARLMDPEILAGASVRHIDGANTNE